MWCAGVGVGGAASGACVVAGVRGAARVAASPREDSCAGRSHHSESLDAPPNPRGIPGIS